MLCFRLASQLGQKDLSQPRGLVGHMPLPFFGRSVNLISTRMVTLCPPHSVRPTWFFLASYAPTLATYDSLHQFFYTSVSLKSLIQRHMIQKHVRKIVWQYMDFITFSPATNFRLNRFWVRIKLHFKKMYVLVYSHDFDLKVCSGHLWITYAL